MCGASLEPARHIGSGMADLVMDMPPPGLPNGSPAMTTRSGSQEGHARGALGGAGRLVPRSIVATVIHGSERALSSPAPTESLVDTLCTSLGRCPGGNGVRSFSDCSHGSSVRTEEVRHV
ncbi:hypothetical protein GCM10022206_14030 [Streptomyces chiangmaiensis]